MNLYRPFKVKYNPYGGVIVESKDPTEFTYLIGQTKDSIIPFDLGTDELLEQGKTILPRHYFLFEGEIDGAIQFKPYEYNKYRIVIATYKGIITNVLSIG